MVSLIIMGLISVHAEGRGGEGGAFQTRLLIDDDLVSWPCLTYQT